MEAVEAPITMPITMPITALSQHGRRRLWKVKEGVAAERRTWSRRRVRSDVRATV